MNPPAWSRRKRTRALIPQKAWSRTQLLLVCLGITTFVIAAPSSEAFLFTRTSGETTTSAGSSTFSLERLSCIDHSSLSFGSVLFLRSICCASLPVSSYPLGGTTRRMRVILGMGKGDGKKRRKKKGASPPSSPNAASGSSSSKSSPSATPPPLRVSNQINIPIRDQIQMAQLNKQASKQAANGFRQKKQRSVRTSYRRAWDDEEIARKAEERRRRGRDPDWEVILSRTATAPLVMVDGYNIIHKWARLKKHMTKGDPQRARQLLVDDLENLQSLKGWRIEVVFDGTKRSTIGPLGQGPGGSNTRPTRADQESKWSTSKHGVRTVFSGIGVEADSYIERRCAEARNVTDGELTGSFIVASDDAMIRLAGQSAGAHCMGADRFVNELKAVRKGIEYRVEAAVAKANGHAIRPEKLRNTPHTPRFGRRSVLIEDKRNRTKAKKGEEEELDLDLEIEQVDGVPWWAQLPNETNPYR